jgi:hypothetical protein
MIFNARFNALGSEIRIVLWKLVYFEILNKYNVVSEKYVYCFCYQVRKLVFLRIKQNFSLKV